jgi:hypothetical protein
VSHVSRCHQLPILPFSGVSDTRRRLDAPVAVPGKNRGVHRSADEDPQHRASSSRGATIAGRTSTCLANGCSTAPGGFRRNCEALRGVVARRAEATNTLRMPPGPGEGGTLVCSSSRPKLGRARAPRAPSPRRASPAHPPNATEGRLTPPRRPGTTVPVTRLRLTAQRMPRPHHSRECRGSSFRAACSERVERCRLIWSACLPQRLSPSSRTAFPS